MVLGSWNFCNAQVSLDEDTGQTVISGMGELHLDIYVERMKREYKVEVDVGQPRVNYREAITKRADFDYLHKKQSGWPSKLKMAQKTGTSICQF